jgi:octopine/nopaline transport system permease protein
VIDFAFLVDTMAQLLAALPTTIALMVSSVALGGVLAAGLAAMRLSGHPAAVALARAYVFVFRGSPLLIQLFLIYYGLAQFDAVRASPLWLLMRHPFGCATLALALCTAAYTSEIFRGGVQAVPRREIEAARACGMSGWLLLRRIVAPLALRQALPAYSNELILMVKSTTLAGLVTVWEVTGVAQRIIASTYRTGEVFLCAATIYLVLNFLIARGAAGLEYRLSAHRRPMLSNLHPNPSPRHAE